MAETRDKDSRRRAAIKNPLAPSLMIRVKGKTLFISISIMAENSSSLSQEPTPDCSLDQVLIIDVETTGLSLDTAQVIEVAAIQYSVRNQTILQQFSTLLPAESNPAESINRIKPEALRAIPTKLVAGEMARLKEMAQRVELVVSHNAEFDKAWFGLPKTNGEVVLPTLLNAYGEDLPWVCTCKDFDWPRQQRAGQKLIELAVAHDIPVFGAHRALYDCQLIAALFERMENLPAMFARALRPKALFEALVSYEQKDLAKQRGFHWHPYPVKKWLRKMAVEDIKDLPFRVRQINDFDIYGKAV